MTKQVTARIDRKLKTEAEFVFSELGLTPAAAVSMFNGSVHGQAVPMIRENLVFTLIGKAAEIETAVKKCAPQIERSEIDQPGFR